MCADTPEYKTTLNLPKTDFPMRAGLPKREPAWLERWNTIGVYDRLRDKAKSETRPSFTLHDGPPYANGHLHIGHALNKILKDFVVRSQQMMGKDARYIPGWDCHGLPIEWKIEEKYREKGRDKDDVPVVEFRQECREFAKGWVDIQREEFKRLGVTGKWENPYLTMDFHAERVIAEEFQKFLMNGTLYQGSKPVMWSPVEQTALAEAEVEYHDKESFTIWVKFEAVLKPTMSGVNFRKNGDGKSDPTVIDLKLERSRDLEGAKVVIWTTTPWTIPSNKGVVYGEDYEYGLYEVVETPEECWAEVGEKFLLVDKLAGDVFAKARLEESHWKRVRGVSTDELAGFMLKHPFHGVEDGKGEWDALRDFRSAPFVTDEDGTGFVHCAPSHGMDEFELYRDLGMLEEVITYNVTEDGSYRADLPLFGGKRILRAKAKKGNWEGDANGAVIAKLAEVDGLLARGKIKHSYPHSWRSKAPIIFRNTAQWFASVDKEVGDGQDTYGKTIRERALRSIDELVTWTPQKGRNRLYAMIQDRPDWVLSRQRAWGVPLTCFTKKGALPTDDDFLLRNDEVNSRVTVAFEVEGADAWYMDGAKARFLDGIVNPDDYNQVMDVLDVWFDSGSTHAFTLRDREDGSDDGLADLYLEGTDQHRGWFHSSLLQGCGTMGRAPYRGVMTCGFTLDAKGMKMSKSVGNIIAPKTIADQYGADILRLWVAQVDYENDQRIGDEILKGVSDSYRRLRNTMRFLLGSLNDFSEADRVDAADMPELERWVLHRLSELDETVRKGYAAYDFQGVFQAVFSFATVELSAFYFDVRKDVLYCDGNTDRRKAARTVLDILFHRLTTWLAPILVFTMEEVWLERHAGDDVSIHLEDMPETPMAWRDAALAEKWEKIRKIRRVATYALEQDRIGKIIGSSLEAKLVLFLSREFENVLDDVDLADIFITSDVEVRKSLASLAIDTATGDEKYGILVSPRARDINFQSVPEITEHAAVLTFLADGEKCQRCWKILPDVGTHAHEGVCGRCDAALV